MQRQYINPDNTMLEDDFITDDNDIPWSETSIESHFTKYSSSNEMKNKFPANLEGGNYSYADLRKQSFPCASIMATDMRYANLENVNLIGANISYANFRGAKIKNADLEYAEINRSDFSFSDLSGANLQGANLIDCDLQFADLRHTDLTDCLINFSNFYLSIYDEYTLLPFDASKAKQLGMQFISSKNKQVA